MIPQTTQLSSTNLANGPISTHQTTQPSSTRPPRCRHHTLRGRQCRLRALDGHNGLCFRHSALNAAALPSARSDSTDLSSELLPELSEFSSGTDLRQFLARLLILVTRGRISSRRAAVLANIANQLLHSAAPSPRNRPTSLCKSSLVRLARNVVEGTSP